MFAPSWERGRDPTRDNHSHALLVDSDHDVGVALAYGLRRRGFAVEHLSRGDSADHRLETGQTPDLAIVAWNVPGVAGLEICRRARARFATRDLPIILVATQPSEQECITGLDTGADDFVAKPFSMREMMARVHALMRRTRPKRWIDVQSIGDIVIDRAARRVTRGDRDLHLAPLEYHLLDCLARRPGQVFTRSKLVEAAWPEGASASSRTVDVHLGRLRRTLNIGAEPDPILTIYGEGYMFDEAFGSVHRPRYIRVHDRMSTREMSGSL